MRKVPQWVYSCAATVLLMSLSFRIVGLDLFGHLNTLILKTMNTSRGIEASADEIKASSRRLESAVMKLEASVNRIESRQVAMELKLGSQEKRLTQIERR